MTILIPYTADDGISLKYTLRGIEKHLSGNEVVLIGDPWGKCECIPYKERPGLFYKERNIFEKLLQGPDEFLMMNDDHFLLLDYDAEYFPYYYQGTLKDRMKVESGSYDRTMENTLKVTGDIPYFDVHAPMKMSKQTLIEMNWDWPEFGYCIKTLYCHTLKNGIVVKECTDLKFNRYGYQVETIESMIKGRGWFSTNHEAMSRGMIEVLEKLYPYKSKYE